ncbi:methyl-accepting chemotaxis protein [Terrilactibacillus laevilacticus]|uniref:Methyl-accepting chemotaxis protein n=1 Tax=Terrilactibacillus laevilacticus TaxID=1380157 RepID=A0ABW5PRT5_9BACI|nr:methyl-accepting chemotaxis protein [Terrilactibacillus laevilacticus]
MNRLKWKHLKLNEKYSISLIAIFVLWIISTVISCILLLQVEKSIDNMGRQSVRSNDISEMSALFRSKGMYVADYLINPSDDIIELLTKDQAKLTKLERKIGPYMNTSLQKSKYNKIIQYDSRLYNLFQNEFVPAVLMKKTVKIQEIKEQEAQLRNETIQLLDQLKRSVKSSQAAEGHIQNTINVIILGIIVSLGLSLMIFCIIHRLMKKDYQQVLHVTDRMAEGDLDTKPINIHSHDEFGQVADSVNKMRINMKRIIQEIVKSSHQVSKNSEHLLHSTQVVTLNSHNITETMNELSKGLNDQTKNTQNVATLTSQFMHDLENETSNARLVEDISHQVIQLTSKGGFLIDQAMKNMKETDNLVDESLSKMIDLNQRTQDMSKLVSLIQNISEKTKLLALNASIEAARAGIDGKGFDVIAHEIRALSEQSQLNVKMITDMILGVKENVDQVSQSLERVNRHVKESSQQMQITNQQFIDIKAFMFNLGDKIKNITKRLININLNGKHINSSIEQNAAMFEETHAGFLQISTSMEHVDQTVEDISLDIHRLTHVSKDLKEVASLFTVTGTAKRHFL